MDDNRSAEDKPEEINLGELDSADTPVSSEPENVSPAQNVEEISLDNNPVHSSHTPKKKWYSFLAPEHIFIPPLRRKLGSKARPLGVVVIIILVCLIGGGLYWKLSTNNSSAASKYASNFKLSVARFKLVSTVPARGATNVNTASKIVLNFNKPVTASKMINNMFVTPSVSGSFKQGSNPDQVVFTPNTALSQGTKFGIMLNATYQSNSGQRLASPYVYNFTTSIPANNILFQDQGGLIDDLTSLSSGQKETYTLFVGSQVGSGAKVTLYQGDVTDMLDSLVYSNTTAYGQTTGSFNDLSVSTSDLKEISTQSNVTNNATFSVTEPDGLYVAVATNSSGQQVGLVWIDFSSFGVLLRQDDQKIVMDAQSFSSDQNVSASASLYNLDGGVKLLTQDSVNGLTTLNLPFSPSLDIIVATSGSETAIVPVNIPNSGGDIRVDQNLSTTQEVYGITDRPTYQAGSNVEYAGYVRNDNDAIYTNPASGTVKLYVASYKGGTPLTSFTASVDSNGMFSGSIPTMSSWLTAGDAFDQFQIFASAVDGNSNNDIPIASFTLTSQSNSATNLSVSFSKSSYLSSDSVTATITGTANGQPLANKTIDLHIFSQDYYENDPAANLEDFGSPGIEIPSSPISVQLNASGQATYTLNLANLPNDNTSQEVTLQANLPNQSGVGAAGGASTVIHQGDGILSFGTDRTSIPSGDDLTAEVYATYLNGSAYTSNTVNYNLVDTVSNASLATGSVITNGSGEASIDIPAAKLPKGDYMELEVSLSDEYGNTIQATNYYNVATPIDETYDQSGAGLLDLNITGSSTNVAVGDQVSLNINSPANVNAVVTMDRGRIYNQSMLSLSEGNNAYSFNVSAELAPSFTLTFNYFLNGIYHSEGVAFNVADPSQIANVKISPTSQTLKADQSTTVQITTTDNNGDPLATNLIAEVVSSNSYDLTSSVSPNIYSTLYNPRPIMTSSASSLSPIGSGGGRCGGGGGDLPSFANAVGTTLYWQPELSTNSSGAASITFTPPSGSWTINVYAMSGNTQVGSATDTLTSD